MTRAISRTGVSRPIADADPGATLAKSLIDYVTTKETERGRWRVYPAVAPHVPIAHGVDWSIRLIAPSQAMALEVERAGTRAPTNLWSGVLRVEIGGHAAIIGGDAQLRTWALLPQEDVRARVFRIPHHGGDLSRGGVPEGWDAARLYEAVQPEVAVLSVGRGHDHPDLDWIRPVTGGGACRLICTQVTHRCEPAMSKQPPALRASAIQSPHFVEPPWRHLEARDRPRRDRYEIPCAGTVLVELRDDGELRVLPQRDGPHRRLVDGWRSPRCRPELT